MSNRRIARRVASTEQVNNRCSQTVDAPTLATKVLHLLLPSFPRAGRGWRGGGGWLRENL